MKIASQRDSPSWKEQPYFQNLIPTLKFATLNEISVSNNRSFDFHTYLKERQNKLNTIKQDFEAKTSHAKQDLNKKLNAMYTSSKPDTNEDLLQTVLSKNKLMSTKSFDFCTYMKELQTN